MAYGLYWSSGVPFPNAVALEKRRSFSPRFEQQNGRITISMPKDYSYIWLAAKRAQKYLKAEAE